MSQNYKQKKIFERCVGTLKELQILRFFTTLAVLTILFVLVLRFVQQTSVTSDKIKPVEASMAPSEIQSLIDFTSLKTQNHLSKTAPAAEKNPAEAEK